MVKNDVLLTQMTTSANFVLFFEEKSVSLRYCKALHLSVIKWKLGKNGNLVRGQNLNFARKMANFIFSPYNCLIKSNGSKRLTNEKKKVAMTACWLPELFQLAFVKSPFFKKRYTQKWLKMTKKWFFSHFFPFKFFLSSFKKFWHLFSKYDNFWTIPCISL